MSTQPPSFQVHVRPDRSRVVVRPEGEIDISTVDEVREQLVALRSVGWKRIVLDLRGVSFLDSTGLRLLVEAHQESERDDLDFSIVEGGEAVARVLEISGVGKLLPRADPRP